MEMRAVALRTVFTAHEKTDRILGTRFAEPPHEFLEMRVVETRPGRQMLVAIGQRDETVALIGLGLAHAPGCPLARPLQAAADALSARQLQLPDDVETATLDENDLTVGALIRRQRTETGHRPISEANATPHGGPCEIRRLGALGRLTKATRRGLLVDGLTAEGGHRALLWTRESR